MLGAMLDNPRMLADILQRNSLVRIENKKLKCC
jgi:hypothetical protein